MEIEGKDNPLVEIPYQLVGKPTVSLVTGLLDYIGLGDWIRKDILNTDRYREKVYTLEQKLAKINASYTDKAERLQAQIDALNLSGLPLPGKASSLISQKRQELMNQIATIHKDQALVSDYGEIAKKTLDTSDMHVPDFVEYNRKKRKYKDIEGEINEKLQKSNIEERL